MTGFMIGRMAGPQAAAIGAAVGAGVGAVSGWWSGQQEEKRRQETMSRSRHELEAQFGSVEGLRAAADRLSVSWDAIWDTRDGSGTRARSTT